MKNRSRKRTLAFERLETKATPAVLLVALAPLDDATHERVEPVVQDESESLGPVDTSANWQFCHSVVTLLQFVDEHTMPGARESAVCSPPTWDQCHSADEMMKLQDRDLRTLVMADRLDSSETFGD
jgi:hypothetical protein